MFNKAIGANKCHIKLSRNIFVLLKYLRSKATTELCACSVSFWIMNDILNVLEILQYCNIYEILNVTESCFVLIIFFFLFTSGLTH